MEWIKNNYGELTVHLPYKDSEIVGDVTNTLVFLHPYEYRGADHIFVQTDENETQAIGAFLFRISSDELMERFDEGLRALSIAGFCIIHSDEVEPTDWEAYKKTEDQFVDLVNKEDLERPIL